MDDKPRYTLGSLAGPAIILAVGIFGVGFMLGMIAAYWDVGAFK